MEKEEEKKGTRKETTGINSLPETVFDHILSLVPTKTIVICKSVSKPWHHNINNPTFIQQLLANSPLSPLLFINPSQKIVETSLTLYLLEGETLTDFADDTDLYSSQIEMLKGTQNPFITRSFKVFKTNVSSCQGFLCCAPRGAKSDHVIVSNPLTGEYLTVKLSEVKSRCHGCQENSLISYFIGLGFSKTKDEFKMLRLCRNFSKVTWWVEISLVGTEEWQRVEIPVTTLEGKDFEQEVDDIVYINGVIYWTYRKEGFICCFDFGSEEFRVLNLPDGILYLVERGLNIGVLGGSLCVSMVCPCDVDLCDEVYGDEYDNMCVELWMIEKDGSEWNWRNLLVINIESYLKKREKWSEEYKLGCFKAIKYLECGKILLYDDQDMFLIYDPATDKSKFIRVLDDSCLDGLGKSSTLGVVPHVPSLVSLRDALKIEDESVVKKYYY